MAAVGSNVNPTPLVAVTRSAHGSNVVGFGPSFRGRMLAVAPATPSVWKDRGRDICGAVAVQSVQEGYEVVDVL